jgi:hypothetical protein
MKMDFFISHAIVKITTIALSCIEVDYKTVVCDASESIWLTRIVGKLKLEQKQETPLLYNNHKVIKSVKNSVFHVEQSIFKFISITSQRWYKIKILS